MNDDRHKEKLAVHLTSKMMIRLTEMAELRELTVHKLVEELIELGLMSLAEDARPPALESWRMRGEPFLGFQGDKE